MTKQSITYTNPAHTRNEPRTMVAQSAKAAGHCPTCTGAARIYEANGDYNACADCDGTGSWSMYNCFTLNPVRVR